jgi:hypothetical protein
MFSCLGFLTGDFYPICNAPMLGAHKSLERTRRKGTSLSSQLLGDTARLCFLAAQYTFASIQH